MLDRKINGELENEQSRRVLSRKYDVVRNGMKLVIEELKLHFVVEKRKESILDHRYSMLRSLRVISVKTKERSEDKAGYLGRLSSCDK